MSRNSYSGQETILTIGIWVVLFVTAVTIAVASPFGAQKPAADKPAKAAASTSEPLPDGAMKEAATTACTECHDSSIILQQRLSKAAWTKTVDKMIKWGATVDPKNHDPLIDYLSTNLGPDKPPYEPPKTALEKSSSLKGSK
jgi:cytochrome c5